MSDDIRIAACREEDVPALMRFIDAHWQAGHILSRDEVLLRWQFVSTAAPRGRRKRWSYSGSGQSPRGPRRRFRADSSARKASTSK